jgi:EpsD family peptidyl-prolyl cis-trans isomerase
MTRISMSVLSTAGRAGLVAVACSSLLFATGCSDKKKDKPASQTAAKVNKEEITVHQINYLLGQRPIPPALAASASKQALERLIDQELVIQQAAEQKIDRDPQVVQQVEAARRDIIARAYVERIGAGATRPTAEEVKRYFDENPALFKERRIYSFQELAIEATADQVADVRAKVQQAKSPDDLSASLKAANYRFNMAPTVKAAEQLPLANLPAISKLKDGEALINAAPPGVQVLVLVESRSQPVDEQRALPLVEQFLLNERKRKAVEDNIKALRSTGKIEYVGEFAGGPGAAASAAPVDAPATTVTPEPAAPAASLERGLKGLK